ncbi:MAG TPA: Coenzyme F420 hydrogenase/dehydrogenase, beta subunit C-terminal domain [Smithella sp.]|jgi:coenzyme F420 hydrogenase subunit beta|nr:Coenzyme F420 hydrogenase/dehydrogenase, beta subunit C-terminal domain [Smithella sp.]HOG11339.1 Coenzyme F420 hydrogenase/dehydrogenase, beta subunit C-terminal domain [Smithella sp.]HOO35232.1 Coenzyme F420 hydrogenase/dehydrogenase, beta subunit C-terminal domain [Smithella sp.]HPL47581.1 Coenzyme F420 hydrogenase/dehydrogenase, beta subunit C-terminal domain [Smithella sp.]HPR16371.1 Coenzyme F420 hydrogenase/dehydrogenase, beta subunit C-terminal domain [Smithella sp.]
MMTGSQKFLKKHVLDEGLCTGCGACVGICPYQVIYHDRTVQLHGCDLVKGRCYDYCPRTPCDVGAIRERYCAAGDLTPEIGAVKGYYFSRAADPGLRNIGQHGATVTAMLELALSEGLIDAAVVSSRDQLSLRKGVIVQNREAIRTHAGSQFTVSATVAAFHQLVTKQTGQVGIVATPCQALALAKMKFNPGHEDIARVNQLTLVIGLYCGWTLSEEKYLKLLTDKGIALESITKMDIPAGRNVLEIRTEDRLHSIAMEEAQTCIREACLYCMDSTAEFADVSVGSARFSGNWEDVRQWNQLIVRTTKGKELTDLAVEKGVLELREAPADSLKELKEAAVNKKKNALKNIIQKSGSAKNLLYLDSRDPAVLKYLEAEKKKSKK